MRRAIRGEPLRSPRRWFFGPPFAAVPTCGRWTLRGVAFGIMPGSEVHNEHRMPSRVGWDPPICRLCIGAPGAGRKARCAGSERLHAAASVGGGERLRDRRAAGDTASAATAEAVQTVEVAKLADTNPVTCRDILIQGSNVLRTQCMTRNDWKIWNRAQEIWAQDMVLRMQHMKR